MSISRLSIIIAAALFVMSLPAVALSGEGSEEVRFTTDDGFELVGDLYESDDGSPFVLLLHQLGSDRSEFTGFAMLLQRNGFHVLAYDARGHGQSTMRDGEEVTWESFDDELFADMTIDIDAAVSFMEYRLGERGPSIGLVGASIQSSTALMYAADHDSVKALVMLSPGLDYKGIDTEDPMDEYSGRPVYLVAAEGDEESFRALNVLKELAGDKALVRTQTGDAHGAALLDKDPTLSLKLESWLERNLKK